MSAIDQADKRALCAFLETLMEGTEPNTIVVSPATVPFLERRFELIPAGMDEPGAARVYLVGGRERSGLDIGGRRATPFVGRTQELAVLRDCLRRARTGRGQVVGIVGDPGIGKSRLVHEFRASPEAVQTAWLTGHCLAHGRATPYLPIVEILRKSLSMEDDDHPAHIGEKLRQGVRQLDPILEWTLPLLGELFGLMGEDETSRKLDPKVKRQRTFEALRSLTVAMSQRRPHVVIFEDLHWLDSSTGDYLAFFIESLAGLPLLILTTQRPGYTVRWADKTYYTQIALDVLGERETEAMITGIVGSTGLPPDLTREIQEKTEGNPLFIEEITTSLLERSVLTRNDTGGARDSVIEIPVTLQDIVRARIDRLEEPVKRTLQTASVIGRHFGLGLLARVAAAGGDVESHLEMLTRAELVHEKRLLPRREYTFKHSVIHDVAYQSLMAHERQELHGAVAPALEALCGDRLEEQAESLAHHDARSPLLAKAVAFALLAGDRAARLFANAEATTYYERALAIARTLPPSPEADRWQIDAILKLAGVGATRQDIERDRLNLESARGLAERLNDQALVARVLSWLGRIHYMLLDAPTAIEYARRSLEIADKLGDDAIAAPPVNLLGRVYSRISPLAQAGVMMERSVGQMRRLGDKNEESTAAALAGEIFGSMGDFSRAFSYADQAIRLAREIKNPFAEACALHLRGLIRDQHGDWVQAIADYGDAARIAEGAKDPFRVYIVRCLEGRACLMSGDPAWGRVLIEQSLQLAGQIGTRFVLAWQKTYLAACLVALGDLATALALCDEAIRLSEDTGEGFIGALAHRTLGEALLRVEPPDVERAEQEMLKAIQIQQEIGARPELARSHLSYAWLLQRRGEKDRAQEQRTEAVRLLEEMGMTWDLAQAERCIRFAQAQ